MSTVYVRYRLVFFGTVYSCYCTQYIRRGGACSDVLVTFCTDPFRSIITDNLSPPTVQLQLVFSLFARKRRYATAVYSDVLSERASYGVVPKQHGRNAIINNSLNRSNFAISHLIECATPSFASSIYYAVLPRTGWVECAQPITLSRHPRANCST